MKKLLLLTIALLFFSASFSQEYEKDIEFPENQFCQEIIQHYDQGFIFLVTTNTNPAHFYFKKIDANGNLLWDKCIRFEGFTVLEEDVTQIANCQSDGSIIVLTTAENRSNINNQMTKSPFMFKLDANMELVWALDLFETYPTCDGYPLYLETDNYGNVYFGVQAGFECVLYPTWDELVSFQRYGKISPQGKLLWFSEFCTPNYGDFVKDLSVNANMFDHAPYLTDNGDLLAGGDGGDYFGEEFKFFPRLYKIDKDGNLMWETYWDNNITPSQNMAGCLGARALFDNGNIISISRSDKYNLLLPNEKFLVFNDKGVSLYAKDIKIEGVDSVYHTIAYNINKSVIQADNNSIIMFLHSGMRYYIYDKIFITKFNENLDEVKTIRDDCIRNKGFNLDKDNPMQFKKTIGGDIALFKKFSKKPSGNPYQTMFTFSKISQNLDILPLNSTISNYDYLATKPINSTDTLVIPRSKFLNPFGTTNKTEINEIAVYPNPANSVIKVEFPTYSVVKENSHNLQFEQTKLLKGEITLQIVDNAGKTVFSNNYMAESKSANIDISALNSGVYYLQLVKDNKVVGFGKVVKK